MALSFYCPKLGPLFVLYPCGGGILSLYFTLAVTSSHERKCDSRGLRDNVLSRKLQRRFIFVLIFLKFCIILLINKYNFIYMHVTLFES